MSVHLIGGGRDLELAPVTYRPFVTEAHTRAVAEGRSEPRIGVIVVAEPEELEAGVAWFAEALARCGTVQVLPATATEDAASSLQRADGTVLDPGWFAGLDGLLVGGGLTPAYHRVLQPHREAVRAAVRRGLPYAGFSAGAMIAAERALLGGWRLGETAVTHEDNGEDLDQLTVVDGLGLIEELVDVHVAQWGTLSRLVAAVTDGRAGRGIGVDENTVVIVDVAPDSSDLRAVHGAGQAWLVESGGGVVRVDRRPAG